MREVLGGLVFFKGISWVSFMERLGEYGYVVLFFVRLSVTFIVIDFLVYRVCCFGWISGEVF